MSESNAICFLLLKLMKGSLGFSGILITPKLKRECDHFGRIFQITFILKKSVPHDITGSHISRYFPLGIIFVIDKKSEGTNIITQINMYNDLKC